MPSIIDVVKGDGFSVIDMVESVNRLPHQPTQIRSLNLVGTEGITTTAAQLDVVDGVVMLVPNSKRGGPGSAIGTAKARGVQINLLHLQLEGEVKADDVQGIRDAGSPDARKTVAGLVNQKMQIAVDSINVTWEHLQAGMLKGLVWDADGSTLVDLYATLKVAKPADVDFLLGTGTTDIRDKILGVKETIEKNLGGFFAQSVRCVMGSKIFRRFIAHAEVKNAYKDFQSNAFNRSDPRQRGFEFAEVFFESYRGQVNDRSFIDPNEMRFFPVGGPGLYRGYFGPADYLETVNMMGQPFYAKQKVNQWETAIDIQVQSNPLFFCARPESLVKGYSSN